MTDCPHCGRSLKKAKRGGICPHCHGDLAHDSAAASTKQQQKNLPTGTLDLSEYMGTQDDSSSTKSAGPLDHLIPPESDAKTGAKSESSTTSPTHPEPSSGQARVHETLAGGPDATKNTRGSEQTLVGTPPDTGFQRTIDSTQPLHIDDIPPLNVEGGSSPQDQKHSTTLPDQTMVGAPPDIAAGDQTMHAPGGPADWPKPSSGTDQATESSHDRTIGAETPPSWSQHGSSAHDLSQTDSSGYDSRTVMAPGYQDHGSVEATVQSGFGSKAFGSQPSGSGGAGSGKDSANDVRNLWEGFADSRVGPMASIKSDDMAVGRDEGLVIHRRALAPADAPEADESDYKVVRYLGQGAMGVVFEAKQTSMQRGVAIKTLRPELARKGGDRQKFLYEASITGNLDHPNIVPIHDVGVNPDGTLFYSMKRVEGTPWQNVMHTKSRAENIDILLKVADAVSFAHSRNVIHRDLKPENVMLGQFGEVLVMDWGLAVNLDKGKDFVLGGTPAYMAPEMARHQVDLIDGRSDIYLLGAILFQLVVGLPPHPGETVTQCVSAAARNQIIPVDSADELLSIAMRAMETDPKARFEDVPVFQQAIRDYQDHAESIQMTQRAEEDLEHAIANRDYPAFSRARFGFEDAVKLWPENRRAADGVKKSKLAHATEALARQDFELGMSLLDEGNPEETTLYNQLAKGAKERENRLKRIKAARMSAFLFMATALIVAGIGAALVNQQRVKAERAQKQAEESAETARLQKAEADRQRSIADVARDDAETAKKAAERDRDDAQNARSEAESARDKARIAEDEAKKNLKIANEQRQEALEARTAALRSKIDATDKSVEAAMASVDIAESNIEVLLGKLQADLTLIKANLADWNVQPALAGLQSIIRNSDERVSYPISFKDWETYRLLYLAQAGRPKFEIDTSSPIVDVAFADNGKVFAVASRDGAIRVYANDSRELLHTLEVPDEVSEDIRAVDITSDGTQLVAGLNVANSANLYFWDLTNGQRLSNQPTQGHDDAVNDLHFSADGLTLVTCGREVSSSPFKTVRWWTRNSLAEPFTTFREGDLNYAESFQLDLSRDGKRVLAICDKAVDVLRDGEVVNRRVAAMYLDSEFGDRKILSAPVVLEYSEGDVLAAVFDPSDPTGNQILATTSDGLLLHWQIESIPEANDNAPNRVATNVIETRYEGHDRTKGVIAVAAARVPGRSENNEPQVRIATGGADGRLILWNKSTVAPWKSLVGHTGPITDLGFFGGGMSVYSGCEDGQLRLWETRELVDELALEPRRPDESPVVPDVLDHSFSQSEPWIAGGDQLGQVTIWNAASGDELGSMRIGHEYGREMISDYDPETARLMTSSAEGSTRLWDANTGRLLNVWDDTSRPAETIGISPNHRWMVQGINAGAQEQFLRRIDLHAPEATDDIVTIPFREFEAGSLDIRSITAMAISDDGNLIAFATGNAIYGYLVDSQQVLMQPENEATSLRFFANSDIVISAETGNVRVFSPDNWNKKAVKFDTGMINTRILDLRPRDDHVFVVMTGQGESDDQRRQQVRIFDCTDWASRESMSSNYTEAPAFGPAMLDGNVTSATFDPAGENLVLLVEGGGLQRWSFAENQLQSADELNGVVETVRNGARLSNTQSSPPLQQIKLTATNEVVLAGPGFASVWSLEAKREKFQVPTALPVRSARFSPRSNRLVVTHGNGQVRVWDVTASEDEKEPLRWSMETLIPGDFRLALPSPVDDRLLLLNSQGALALYDSDSGNRLTELSTSDKRTVTAVDWVAGEGASSWLIVGTKGGFSSLLKVDGETINVDTLLPVIPNANADISAVALSPDRHYAAVGNVKGEAILVSLDQWRRTQEQPPALELRDAAAVESLEFNPSSTRLLLSQAQRASLWHLDRLNPGLVRPLLNLDHNHIVRRSIFSPGGLMIASVPQDEGRIVMWKATPWQENQGEGFDEQWAPIGKSIDERRQVSRAALAAAEEAKRVAEQELKSAQDEQERAAIELETAATVDSNRDEGDESSATNEPSATTTNDP